MDWHPISLRGLNGPVQAEFCLFDPRVPAETSDFELLSETERARAQGLRRESARGRFVRARAMTRRALGEKLCLQPAAVAIIDAGGKPLLERGHFNLSHCEDLAILAWCESWPIGVDLEALRKVPRALDIARRHFCGGEIADLAAAMEPTRSERFLACWTRKEACIKALGLGIAGHLNRFEVGTGEQPLLVPRGTRPAITVQSFRPESTHIASIAVIA